MKKELLLSMMMLFFVSSAQAATLIDTTTAWDGITFGQPFGEPNTATYGQTFTVGADTRLDNFSFYLNDNVDPGFVDFKAYVMAWDGAKATGPILYQSSTMSTNNNGGADGFQKIQINTGGITLVNGMQYVAFFNASGDFDAVTGTSRWGVVTGGDSYAGGASAWLNNGNDFSRVTIDNWNSFGVLDFAFTMNFNTVAPTSVPIFGLPGLLAMIAGLAFIGRRKWNLKLK